MTAKSDANHTTPQSPAADMNPGDQAPPGSPQTGENVCPKCSGKGKTPDGRRCENCGGTGKVIEIVGDA
jgi:DnaJ-class molecular chaperone